MAHAFAGDWSGPCLDRLLPPDSELRQDFEAWGANVHATVGASVGVRMGQVFHLWHGTSLNRRYLSRHTDLAALRYSPSADLALNGDACWTWRQGNSALANYVGGYFADRREDDEE
jgi:hypothetical protein